MDTDNAQPNGHDKQQRAADPARPHQPQFQGDKYTEEAHRVDQHSRKGKPWYWLTPSSHDFWIVVFTAVLTITSIMQAWITRGQLAEMRSGSEDTKKLAQAAVDQADAAKRQADTLRQQMKVAEASASAAKRNAAAALLGARASEQFARTSAQNLEETRAEYRFERRAIIGVKELSVTDMSATKKPHFKVVLANGGKWPARKVKGVMTVDFLPAKLVPLFGHTEASATPTSTNMLPGATNQIELTLNGALSEADIAAIENEQKRYWIFGTIWYVDLVGRHWANFCFQYRAGNTFLACEQHNDSDEDPQ